MARTRVLQERRIPGAVIRLEDDPDKIENYKLRIVIEKEYQQFHTGMDAFRAAVADMVNGNVRLSDN